MIILRQRFNLFLERSEMSDYSTAEKHRNKNMGDFNRKINLKIDQIRFVVVVEVVVVVVWKFSTTTTTTNLNIKIIKLSHETKFHSYHHYHIFLANFKDFFVVLLLTF